MHRVDDGQKLQVPLELPFSSAVPERDADHKTLQASQQARQCCHQVLGWEYLRKPSLQVIETHTSRVFIHIDMLIPQETKYFSAD